jgi:hypothetical protein
MTHDIWALLAQSRKKLDELPWHLLLSQPAGVDNVVTSVGEPLL